MHTFPPRLQLLALVLPALLAGACTSVGTTPRDPLDAGEWRTTKSRMYQDLAMQCLRAGDHARARRLLQEAVQYDAHDQRALELLTRLCWAEGDLDAADGAAALLQRLQPASIEALCTRGAVAEARNRPQDAEAAYRRAAELAPADPRPRIDLHRLLLTQGRDEEAAAARMQLGDAFPQATEAHVDHGAKLAADGRWRDASGAFGLAVQARPEDAGAAARYAISAVMSAQPDAALALGARLPPHLRDDQPSLTLALAVARLQAGDPRAALRELEQGRTNGAEAPAVALLRGELLLHLQQPDAAIAAFERVVASAPGTARAHAGLGRLLLGRGSAHAAARAFERAVALQPEHAGFRVLLATALAGSGDLVGAARHAAIAAHDPAATPLLAELSRLHPTLSMQVPPPEGRR